MWLEGQVDQLEDRYLGMVEASGSNPDLSIGLLFLISMLARLHKITFLEKVFLSSFSKDARG